MYSVKNDLILDPFLGTGTTTIAAMASGRNSLGYEVEKELKSQITDRFKTVVDFTNSLIKTRLKNHQKFVSSRIKSGKEIKHNNTHYNFPVITRQEENLFLNPLHTITRIDETNFEIRYETK